VASFAGWPLTWEPIINCPGSWKPALRKDISVEDAELMLYSFSWLSAVLAKIPMQLYFRLFPEDSEYFSPIVDEGQIIQAGRYARVANDVRAFLFAPPTGVQEPYVKGGGFLGGGCSQCAKLWRAEGAFNGFNALFVVVNAENQTSTASFTLERADAWPGATEGAFCRKDSNEQVIKLHNGKFNVTLAPFDTHVYVTCEVANQQRFQERQGIGIRQEERVV